MTGFDYSNAQKFIRSHEVDSMKAITLSAAELLKSRKGAGNDYLGWINRIKMAAKRIQSDSDVLLVAGIGGSYLGARAAIEFLRHGFYNEMTKEAR